LVAVCAGHRRQVIRAGEHHGRFKLESANIAARALRAGDAALVGGDRWQASALVNCRAACEQRMGLRRATIISERTELGIDWHIGGADLIPIYAVAEADHAISITDQVVTERIDELVYVVAATGRCVTGDDGVLDFYRRARIREQAAA
jgi:hypothetical protein